MQSAPSPVAPQQLSPTSHPTLSSPSSSKVTPQYPSSPSSAPPTAAPATPTKILPAGWHESMDPASGKPFYTNTVTGAIQWHRPEQPVSIAQDGGGIAPAPKESRAPPSANDMPDPASLTPEALEQILERSCPGAPLPSSPNLRPSPFLARLSVCCSCVGQLMGSDGGGAEVMQVMQKIAASMGSYSADAAAHVSAPPTHD
jgi:hypothetical protein